MEASQLNLRRDLRWVAKRTPKFPRKYTQVPKENRVTAKRFEKFGLNVSTSAVVNHPCAFMVFIISLVFFYLSKVLFSGFLQFKGYFVDGQNNSKYRDAAPLRQTILYVIR